jgi:hypothetical protein
MDIEVRKDAMPEEKFRAVVERISKYIHFKGCETEEEIEDKLKEKIKMYEYRYENTSSSPEFFKQRARLRASINRWRGLLKAGFAFRLSLESWLHPHPVYKEILGTDDDIYNMWMEDKEEVDSARAQRSFTEV